MKKVAAAAAIAFTVEQIVEFGRASVEASTNMSNAMMGLQSIMEGQGRSFKKAQNFINDYISDGLIPATKAVNAYKNLALRGYDDSQIQQVMVALKDSAAFGRQSSYTLGEAVETATEGLKNENSILVDNAGVTKNVAKMWDEYAKKIGTTSNNLTQQQKIQAEVNGILEETKYQTGDAAKVADSYSGQVLKLEFAINNLKIAVGNALTPVLKNLIPPISEVINWLTKLANVAAQVSTLLFGKTIKTNNQTAKSASKAASSTSDLGKSLEDSGDAAEKAGKQAKGALASFDELNVLAQDTSTDSSGSSAGTSADGLGGGIETGLDEVDTSATDIDPKILETLEKLKQLLAPVTEALKGFWEQLKIIGGFAWDALKDFYEHFLKPVGEWIFGEDSGLAKFVNIITNGLSQIDWGKINSALAELWDALAPFAINVGEGLLWCLENVLVPLAVWAMNNVVPLVIEGIAAAFEVLNAIIDALKPLGEWLWENFLKPLAEWTGGVIVDILTAVVDGLRDFSDWISENEETVQGITVTVAAFFAAWQATELAAFVVNAGGVIGILEKLGGALYAVTLKKVVDKAETLYLVGLYAKDFAVALANNVSKLAADTAAWVTSTAAKVANTAAQVAMTAATTAWNAICAVATGVTTAFGAAVGFLTSPVGLVVLAIGALIAVVVLLATHWDEVKEKASEVWSKIKEVWNRASDWFDEKVLSPLKTSFKGAVNFIIGLAEGMANKWIRAINKIIEALNTIHFDLPDWIPVIGGNSFGIDIPELKEIKIPRLATGAVIPPNQQFMAVLGDQKNGRNLEAPENLIRQIMREELSGLQLNGGDITIKFEGNLSQLARVLNPVIKKEQNRVGKSLQVGGAY